jgi:hypothetical protein
VGETVRLGHIVPGHIVAVADFSPDTLRSVIDHLEVSTSFEHFVFREAELCAIWSLTGFALGGRRARAEREAVTRLRDAVLQAHDLLGRKQPLDAMQRLRPFAGLERAPGSDLSQ